jgi:TRAP-type mannitol/chloroaromatic compound transport system permease large subunit
MNPALGPAIDPEELAQVTKREKYMLLLSGLMPLAIFAVMMVPFVLGYTRLVESAVVGAISALAVSVAKGRMTWAILETCTKKTLAISCMFLWIILAALAFGAVFDGLRAVDFVRQLFMDNLGLGRWEILILMQVSFLLMGMFLDDTAMLVIVAPLYVPIVQMLEFNLIWYGVLYTITCQIAYMTPPFGYNLFLMRAMAPNEVTLTEIYRSIIPFVGVMIIGLGLVMAFPQIALWLPSVLFP